MTQEVDLIEDERHLISTLVKLTVFLALLFVAARFLAQKRHEFAGLTESEARAKFVDKVGPKLGDDTAEEIADQVIPKLKERGLLQPDLAEAAADEAGNVANDVAEEVSNAADAVSDAVDSVVKD